MELTPRALISVIAIGIVAIGCDRDAVLSTERRQVIAGEMEEVLLDELHAWYPLVVDTLHGGYLSRFTYDWKPEEAQDKMIVTQARHVWTASKAAVRYLDDPRYAVAAEHGYRFLRDVMWDSLHGGFYNLVQRDGTPIPDADGRLMKQAYGNAFGIYALAAYYGATHEAEALNLARSAFNWLEEHSHDPVSGGYYQFMGQNGTSYSGGYGSVPPKDQNSSIHLLEAFTELYTVWPDPLLKERLQE
ncbi:MAG: AGE family epimerase/isomerase, partial [Rhodothermales bacterium]